jgi:outer membrane lipoprotein SlyB
MSMIHILKTYSVVLLVVYLMAGCASSVSSGAYSRSQTGTPQQVELGYVESVRPVLIEGTKSNLGTAAGAAIGGVAGGSVDGGTARTLAIIGGAVLGGLAGAATEEGITRQRGQEITVRLDNGRMIAVTQGGDVQFNAGQRVRILTAYDGATRVTP